MLYIRTELNGVYVIELEPVTDQRGFFARTFCEREFEDRGLVSHFVQCNVAWNKTKGTLRGMHYQSEPHSEVKLVRCSHGATYDVVIDLRAESPSYCQWTAVELTPLSGKMVYVPRGCAHGYQTLIDDTEVSYLMSDFYVPGAECGVRWDDPAFAVCWPLANPMLSEKDSRYPDYVRVSK